MSRVCNKVGYCGKLCQRADWKVHKLNCSKPTAVPQNEEIVTRLEKQNDDGTWEDAGPITLLEDGIASISIDGNSSTNNNNTIPSTSSTTTKILTKELPKETQQILQSQSDHYKYQHSKDGIDTNLLIFFHGAGDTHLPFHNLGRQMELPQTATLSLSASISLNLPNGGRGSFVELPFGFGHSWYQEMDYTTGDKLSTNNTKRLASLRHALKILDPLICSLIGIDTDGEVDNTDNNWIPERIFLFGFSSGACLAMEFCRMWAKSGRMQLGCAICICGGFHIDQKTDKKSKEPTDVLVITGDDDYPKDIAEQNKQLYGSSKVQIYSKKGRGNAMVNSKEEMQVIMEFLSKRLVRRMISMESQSR